MSKKKQSIICFFNLREKSTRVPSVWNERSLPPSNSLPGFRISIYTAACTGETSSAARRFPSSATLRSAVIRPPTPLSLGLPLSQSSRHQNVQRSKALPVIRRPSGSGVLDPVVRGEVYLSPYPLSPRAMFQDPRDPLVIYTTLGPTDRSRPKSRTLANDTPIAYSVWAAHGTSCCK